jgi:hypothetical protein
VHITRSQTILVCTQPDYDIQSSTDRLHLSRPILHSLKAPCTGNFHIGNCTTAYSDGPEDTKGSCGPHPAYERKRHRTRPDGSEVIWVTGSCWRSQVRVRALTLVKGRSLMFASFPGGKMDPVSSSNVRQSIPHACVGGYIACSDRFKGDSRGASYSL